MDHDVAQRMRADWNKRAVEDAHYYVAFGRRNQDDSEFFATAHEQVHGLQLEMRRLPAAPPRSRRALEIGCGPGRLMRPMSALFGEIHGVDVSDEMVRLAREKLADIPHAHPHHAPNSNLEAFASDSFDFVYSYAVFQHIPSRDVVLNYLREASRVLKPGGVLRCQINGLPESAPHYDTWSGVRISAAEIRQFARDEGLLLQVLDGTLTQYMWATLVKPAAPAHPAEPTQPLRIRRVTNTHSSEPVAPVRGRFASLSLWLEGLPPNPDLNRLDIAIAGLPATPCYIGLPEPDGLRQLNLYLPDGLPTGFHTASLSLDAVERARATVRLTPPAPSVPSVVSVSDGIDLLSGKRIVTGSVKVAIEEVDHPNDFAAQINGIMVKELEHFCTDPRVPTYEFNFRLPDAVTSGSARISLTLGRRVLGEVGIEIVSVQ